MKIIPEASYLKLTSYEGSDSSTLETVDGTHVKNFVGTDTIRFFENLGGTEVVKRGPNFIEVTSTSPDAKIVRITKFCRA